MLSSEKAQELLYHFFASGTQLKFERKGIIIPYDEPTKYTYFIVKGCVKVLSHDTNGRERIHYLYGQDDYFPVIPLFDAKDYQVEFSAFSNVTVLRKSVSETEAFFEHKPYALLAVIRQQTTAYGRIINLNMGSAEQRIAFRLLSLCEKFGSKVDDHYVIELPITLQELADMVRLTRESAGIVIARLERKGCISYGRRNIILYPEKLKQYATD